MKEWIEIRYPGPLDVPFEAVFGDLIQGWIEREFGGTLDWLEYRTDEGDIILRYEFFYDEDESEEEDEG